MYWAIGYDEHWKRDIGYDVPAICDHPGCEVAIDRGVDYVCGGEPYGGETCCGLYFCKDHLELKNLNDGHEPAPVCDRCAAGKEPYEPSPDTKEWVEYKETSIYWAGWRTYHQNKASS